MRPFSPCSDGIDSVASPIRLLEQAMRTSELAAYKFDILLLRSNLFLWKKDYPQALSYSQLAIEEKPDHDEARELFSFFLLLLLLYY
jgi:hypothetical protein